MKRIREDHAGSLDRRSIVENDLAAVRGRIDRPWGAIADGEASFDDAIKARLHAETERKRALESERAGLDDTKAAALDAKTIARELREKIFDIRTLMAENVPSGAGDAQEDSRPAPIACAPIAWSGRGLRFEGRLTLATLLSGTNSTRASSESGENRSTRGDTVAP